MIEQNLKTLIGEYVFQIFTLQDQLEQANKKIAELEKEVKDEQTTSE